MNKLISGDKLTMIREICKMYSKEYCSDYELIFSDKDFFLIPDVKSLVDQLATADEVLLAEENVNEQVSNSPKHHDMAILSYARREEREGIARWFEDDLQGEFNGKQIAELIRLLTTQKEETL